MVPSPLSPSSANLGAHFTGKGRKEGGRLTFIKYPLLGAFAFSVSYLTLRRTCEEDIIVPILYTKKLRPGEVE